MLTTLRTGALALTSAQYKFGADKNLIIRLTASAAHKLYGNVNITLANVLAINIFQKNGAMIENYFNRTLKFTRISATELEFSEVIDRGIAAIESLANLTNNGSAITATIANASFDLPAGTYNFLLLDSADSVFSTSKIQSQILDVAGTGQAGLARIFDQNGEGDFLSINGLDLQFSYPARISLIENNAGVTNIPLVINAESLSKVIPTPSQKAKTGQETSANSTPVVISSDQTAFAPADRNTEALVVTPAQPKFVRCSFAKTLSGVDNDYFNLVDEGAGQTIAQASGNLTIASGITANSETIIRSNQSFIGNIILKLQTILSQRIANQQFFVELVDVIGDNLTANMIGANSLKVTIGPNNPFTAENIGQSMYIGNIQAPLTGVPGRYTISAVDATSITFTVSGFSLANGTVSLFGWNYYQTIYSGPTPTSHSYDSQAKGWAFGSTPITNANNTNSPGHLLIMGNEDGNAFCTDQAVTSGAGNFNSAVKASRVLNLADAETPLFLQIRCVNGATPPASSTTLTIGVASIENYPTTPVSLYNVKPQGPANAAPTTVQNAVSVIATGITAHNAAATGNPVRVATKTVITQAAAFANGVVSDLASTSAGQLIQKQFGSAENDWQYAAVAGGLISTSVQEIKVAVASLKNYVTALTISATALGAATELVIREGTTGTILFRIPIPVSGLVANNYIFPTPLKTAAVNTALSAQLLTNPVSGGVYVNAQGYVSA